MSPVNASVEETLRLNCSRVKKALIWVKMVHRISNAPSRTSDQGEVTPVPVDMWSDEGSSCADLFHASTSSFGARGPWMPTELVCGAKARGTEAGHDDKGDKGEKIHSILTAEIFPWIAVRFLRNHG